MKKIILGTLLALLFYSVSFAEWQVDFEENYNKKGIDQAVIEALKEGAYPDSIVETGLGLEGLNPQNLVMALYCAGANGQDIRDAAANHDISELVLTAGYKKSIEECGDAVADSQAYISAASGFSSGPSAVTGGAVFASPSTL